MRNGSHAAPPPTIHPPTHPPTLHAPSACRAAASCAASAPAFEATLAVSSWPNCRRLQWHGRHRLPPTTCSTCPTHLPVFAVIKELSPIFFNPITSAEITNVVYAKGWQAQQGPLKPQVAASVRVDGRAR